MGLQISHVKQLVSLEKIPFFSIIVVAVIALIVGMTYQVNAEDPNLVAAYGFNDASNPRADASSKGNNLTCGTACPTYSATGGHNGSGAYNFAGSGNWLTVPNETQFDFTNNMTVSFWMKRSSTGWSTPWESIVNKGDSAWSVTRYNSTNEVSFSTFTPGANDLHNSTGTVTDNNWHHVAVTLGSSTKKIYIDGVQKTSATLSTNISNNNLNVRLGDNQEFSSNFSGWLDDVRIYSRALSASEIQTDMNTEVNLPGDTTAPSVPTGVTANATSQTAVTVSWTASTDNVGVTGYKVYRNGTLVGSPTGTTFNDTGLTASTTYNYTVAAVDAADNASAQSTAATVTTPDTTAPTVSLTAPADNATVSGTETVSANATDNVNVAGVKFYRGTTQIGSEDTSSPYSVSWDTTAVADGQYSLTAVARDAASNQTTSAAVTVTVSNSVAGTPGLVAAYGFNNSSSTFADSSANGNTLTCGTSCPTYSTTGGHNGSGAYDFAGANNWLTVPNESQFDFTNNMTASFWMKRSASGWTTPWESIINKGDSAWSITRYNTTNDVSWSTFTPTPNDLHGTAGTIADNNWHHVAVTLGSSTKKIYIDGVEKLSAAFALNTSNNNLNVRLGDNQEFASNFSGWLDDVRFYNRALSVNEIQTDMNTPVGDIPADTTAPSVPADLSATAISSSQINLSWTASTDNVGVTGYKVYRDGTLVASPTSTTYSDTNLTANTSYSYTVAAVDAAGNASAQTSAVSATTQVATATRDPLKQPFASNSIWNMPIGTGAQYVAANLDAITSSYSSDGEWTPIHYPDADRIILKPNAPLTSIYLNNAGWGGGNRCTAQGGVIYTVPIPADYVVPNSRDNNGAAFLMPDGRTIKQTQPFTRCTAGGIATSMTTHFADVDLYGSGITGAHGGSGLSAIGGSLRVGELRPGDTTGPRHALKMNINVDKELYNCSVEADCFRWPAVTSDSGSTGSYGTDGNNQNFAMRMGALLAIPQNVDINNLGLETQQAKLLAWTLQNYGAYIVDHGESLSVEEGPDGSFTQQFQSDWGTTMEVRVRDNTAWGRDYNRLRQALSVVNNNSSTNIGGGGTPLQPLAPEIQP